MVVDPIVFSFDFRLSLGHSTTLCQHCEISKWCLFLEKTINIYSMHTALLSRERLSMRCGIGNISLISYLDLAPVEHAFHSCIPVPEIDYLAFRSPSLNKLLTSHLCGMRRWLAQNLPSITTLATKSGSRGCITETRKYSSSGVLPALPLEKLYGHLSRTEWGGLTESNIV